MTAIVIPPERLEEKRKERDRERQAWQGSILGSLLDDDEHEPCEPASQAQQKETL